MTVTLSVRAATHEDAELLLRWRNDPETRRASRCTSAVSPAEHFTWLSQTLRSPDRKLFIAEEAGVPVGTVRAHLSEGAWELSWTTAPAFRGRGLAKQMVALVAARIPGPIRAEVKTGNRASVRIAEHLGMTLERETDGILHFRTGWESRNSGTR